MSVFFSLRRQREKEKKLMIMIMTTTMMMTKYCNCYCCHDELSSSLNLFYLAICGSVDANIRKWWTKVGNGLS